MIIDGNNLLRTMLASQDAIPPTALEPLDTIQYTEPGSPDMPPRTERGSPDAIPPTAPELVTTIPSTALVEPETT